MPVHPEVQLVLSAMAEANQPPLSETTVPAARATTEGFVDLQGEPTEMAAVVTRALPGPAGEIPVRVYTPTGDLGTRPVVVFFHGGGWVIGDLEVVDRPCRVLAAATGAVVVSVDYRLAPEHRYPAPFEDCYAATEWVAEHADELGVNPAKLAVAGDSAGGNLAAAVALAARDRGGPAISAQLLIYPVTDFDFTTASYTDNAEGYLLTRDSMRWFWAHYLGELDIGQAPYACPARAESLAGLPPAYVATAEFDPLRDQGEAYAEAMNRAGVAVSAKRFAGLIHGFFWMDKAVPAGRPIVKEMAALLHQVWA
ncbi:alpha/beta hydrolase [Pseudonocardia spinosispora]|uniref:alpha/beta hydrolase n=1 Tax=Pseudonocardia spinosispora TaxID=103441 RepID=UPI00048CB07A|nr:alpha/beta hydrolase [Pseudonocardia spinosispora]